MAKRNDTPRDSHSPDDASFDDNADQHAEGRIKRIAAPRLVPSQDAEETPAIRTDVVTVTFEEAARDAAGSAAGADDRDDGPAMAAFARTKRFIPLAAAIAIAAAVGALTGALTTSGLGHFAGDTTASAAPDNQKFEAAIAKVGRDIAALKVNLDNSARSVTTQMARLSERLEKTDKAQGDAAGKLAKLAETIDRNAGAPATTAAAATASGVDRDVTGSIATTTPAAPPVIRTAPAVVEGWVLRGVQNGTALIQGRIGLVEVEPGDNLPGLGRIEGIRRQDGHWVVVTSRGLITPR